MPQLVRLSLTTSRPVAGSTSVEGASRGRAISMSVRHSSASSTLPSVAQTGSSVRMWTTISRSPATMRVPGAQSRDRAWRRASSGSSIASTRRRHAAPARLTYAATMRVGRVRLHALPAHRLDQRRRRLAAVEVAASASGRAAARSG